MKNAQSEPSMKQEYFTASNPKIYRVYIDDYVKGKRFCVFQNLKIEIALKCLSKLKELGINTRRDYKTHSKIMDFIKNGCNLS